MNSEKVAILKTFNEKQKTLKMGGLVSILIVDIFLVSSYVFVFFFKIAIGSNIFFL